MGLANGVTTRCLDVENLEACLRRALATEQQTTIQAHVARCSDCRRRLTEVAENLRLVESLHVLFHQQFPMEVEEASTPDAIAGYGIVREIGRGGMGIVYEAEQEHPRRAVALKVLSGTARVDKHRVKLFRREAQALGRLRHPCIAAIYDAGHTDEGQHYLAMELARGVPLDEYAHKSAPPIGQRLRLFTRICKAINYAHQCGVIHLDIKPSNILVDSAGEPKILDFGLARIVDPDATMTTSVTDVGRLQGTLPYMSPEQLRGDPSAVDVRSDVYSLGVILYELLTGRLPYELDGSTQQSAMQHICDQPPLKPSGVNRTLRGDLETIMLKALEKEPARRYQNALALVEDIERYESSQPILARPASGLYQFRKLVMRHKAPFAVAAVFVLLVMGFGIWMSTLYAWAQSAEQLAQERLTAMIAARDEARGEAERANRASDLAQQRLEEVEQSHAKLTVVANFQADMLSTISPHRLGKDVIDDLRRRIKSALESTGMTRDEIQKALASFDEPLSHVNRAEFGSGLLHEHILSCASDMISRQLTDQPVVEARLRFTLGNVYVQLGDYDRAEPHLTEAMELWLRELGEGHELTLVAMNDVARLYQAQGRYDEAEPLYVKSMEGRRRVLGDDHPGTLITINNLGTLYDKMGRYEEAEPLLLEALEGTRRVRGADHRETLTRMNSLAGLYLGQAKCDLAEPILVDVLAARRRTLGASHVDTLTSVNNLSIVYKRQGRYHEALPLQLQALEAFRLVLGPEHPSTLFVSDNLASLYSTLGRYRRAKPLFTDTLAARRRLLGEEHVDTMRTVNNFAAMHQALGHYDEAEPLYLEAVEKSRRVLGTENPLTLTFMSNLGSMYSAQGRYDEARPLLVEALGTQRYVLGNEHPSTLRTMVRLAECHEGQGAFEEAEPLYVAAVRAMRSALPERHSRRGEYLRSFGGFLAKRDRYDEAENALLQSYQILQRALGVEHEQTIKTAQATMDLYDTWDKPQKAAEFRSLLEVADASQRGTPATGDVHAEPPD